MSVFAERLRELRGPESQTSFAAAIGIHRVQYVNYESGKNIPSIEVLERICRAHAVSADWLLGLTGNSCTRATISARAGAGGIAIAGSGNRVTGVVAGAPVAAACAKCPYKKKLKALEKVLNK